MREYAVFYVIGQVMSEVHSALYGDGDVAIPTRCFKEDYRFVGTHQAENLGDLFDMMNDQKPGKPNPLGHPLLQELVIRGIPGHTSMSVGDVVADLADQKLLICAPIGWKELELV